MRQRFKQCGIWLGKPIRNAIENCGCIPLSKAVEKKVHTLCCTNNLWMTAQSFSIISG
jgi:hypothetical protein